VTQPTTPLPDFAKAKSGLRTSVVILTVRSRAEGGWTAAHKFYHSGAGSKGASAELFRIPFPPIPAGLSESSVESTTLGMKFESQSRDPAGEPRAFASNAGEVSM